MPPAGIDAPAPTRRLCPAPKILSGRPCGHLLFGSARYCRRHQSVEPGRRCAATVTRGSTTVRCHAWPLQDLACCAAHDPQLKEEARLRRRSVLGELERARVLLGPASPSALRRVIESVVTKGRLTAVELGQLLATYQRGEVLGRLLRRGAPTVQEPD